MTYSGIISAGVLCLLKHSTAAVRKPPNVPSYVYLSVIIPVQFSLRLPDAIILSPCRIHFKHLFVLFAGLRTFYGTHTCMPCPPLTLTFICLVLCLPRSTKKRGPGATMPRPVSVKLSNLLNTPESAILRIRNTAKRRGPSVLKSLEV